MVEHFPHKEVVAGSIPATDTMETKKYFNHDFHEFESGLRLITVPMEGTKTVAVLILVGTGSKYEAKNINGISHFLEHMMFKGTTKRPDKLEIAKELDAIGAEYNAFTNKEYTGYYARASSDKKDLIMDIVSDIFLNSKLDGKDIEIEKGVIVEEINMYRDQPSRYVGELFEKLLYGDQPAGWDTAGEKEIILALKRDDFTNYFNTHYITKNTIVAVAGDITPDYAKERISEYFKNARQGSPVTKLAVAESQSEPQALIYWKETDQTHFNLGVRAFNMFDEKKYALSLMSIVLGGGMSSRLFQEVRDKRGLAYYIGSSNEMYTDSGFLLIRAGVDNRRITEAIEVTLEELRKIKDKGITEDELQKAKDHVSGGLALYLENSMSVAETFAEPILFENRVLTIEDKLSKINKVTVEEIKEIAKEITDNAKLNLALIGPFKEEEPFKKILNI